MKKHLKNGSLMARPARFFLALVSFCLTFSPSLYALTPEQVSSLSTAEKFVYTAYVRALAYFPDRVATGLQKRLGLWAYDPAGHSVYGGFNVTVNQGNTLIGQSTLWDGSPYVNGAPKPCGAVCVGLAGIGTGYCDGNEACNSVTWTRGSTSPFPGSSTCSTYSADHRPEGQVGNSTCGTYSASCLVGGSGETWSSARYGSGSSWLTTGGGMYQSLRQVVGCAPVVPVDEFSTWLSAPLSNAVLADTGEIIKTLQDAAGDPNLTSQDETDIQTALTYIRQGVPVSNGAIPDVYNPPPQDIWDFTDTGTVIGGGGGSVVVASTVISVDLSPVTSAVDQVGDKLTGINDYLVNPDTSPSQGHYNAVQTAFNGLLTSISSMPVMGAMNSLLPQDTTSQWQPCFDLSFAWSGVFAGSRPAAYTGNYCLNSFSGWDTFVNLIRWGFSLGVMVWGVRYLWGGY